jgi:L-ascorbate metabolism protein UlaG (beta-lactamase superfamily)
MPAGSTRAMSARAEEPAMDETTPVYLKRNALIEPLVNQWYAWPYLLSPASAAMFIANAHIKLMQSFVASPQIHVSALKNPANRGGPYLDIPAERAPEVKALLDRTLKTQGAMIELAEAIKALDKILAEEAKGSTLEPLYKKIPPALRGYVELVYDLKDSASVRFMEGLLFKSRYHQRSSQSVILSLMQPDARQFALSTPRLEGPGELLVPVHFDAPALDDLYRMRTRAAPLGAIREALGIPAAAAERFATFFTEEAPRRRVASAGGAPRARYFGHACVLVESPGLTLMFDPVVSYDFDGKDDRFSHADVPDVIDYVVITHNHQDHVLYEALFDLRHRIKTVIVPRGGGVSLADPSLKLILENVGFRDVREIGEMETIAVGDGTLTALPFLGEHGDLDIRTKAGYSLTVGGRSFMTVCDSNNVDPALYEHIHAVTGGADVLFAGMECDGAPMSWLYGPLFTRLLTRKNDQSRRFDGSDCDKVMKIVDVFKPKQVYIYAMGQELWLRHVMNVVYTPESRPIVESDKLVSACRGRGMEAERLYMKKEFHF